MTCSALPQSWVNWAQPTALPSHLLAKSPPPFVLFPPFLSLFLDQRPLLLIVQVETTAITSCSVLMLPAQPRTRPDAWCEAGLGRGALGVLPAALFSLLFSRVIAT